MQPTCVRLVTSFLAVGGPMGPRRALGVVGEDSTGAGSCAKTWTRRGFDSYLPGHQAGRWSIRDGSRIDLHPCSDEGCWIGKKCRKGKSASVSPPLGGYRGSIAVVSCVPEVSF